MNFEKKQKTVFLVDDHPFIREGIIKALGKDSSYTVCGEAGSVMEALTKIHETQPDFTIVDMSLEDGSGMQILEYIRDNFHNCITIVVSMHEEPAYIEQALELGARGYIFKRESIQSVLIALSQTYNGHIYMSNHVTQVLINFHKKDVNRCNVNLLLSKRELEIFDLLGQGFIRRQLAEQLYISERTVDSHLSRIKSKLDCTSTAQLTRVAMQHYLSKKSI